MSTCGDNSCEYLSRRIKAPALTRPPGCSEGTGSHLSKKMSSCVLMSIVNVPLPSEKVLTCRWRVDLRGMDWYDMRWRVDLGGMDWYDMIRRRC